MDQCLMQHREVGLWSALQQPNREGKGTDRAGGETRKKGGGGGGREGTMCEDNL